MTKRDEVQIREQMLIVMYLQGLILDSDYHAPIIKKTVCI